MAWRLTSGSLIATRRLHKGQHPRWQASPVIFADRRDAGQQLARALSRYAKAETVVYAIPPSGAIVGAETALGLDAPLELLFIQLIGHPMFSEYAIGGVTDGGAAVWDKTELGFTTPHWRALHTNQQIAKAKQQRQYYDQTDQGVSGKTAIIVDDGSASGLTIKAAIRAIRLRRPRQLILGLPVAAGDRVDQLRQLVDELVVLYVASEPHPVIGHYYRHYPKISDQQAKRAIQIVSEVGHGIS